MKLFSYYCSHCSKEFYLTLKEEKDLWNEYYYNNKISKGKFKKPLYPFRLIYPLISICPYCKKWTGVFSIRNKIITIWLISILVIPLLLDEVMNIFVLKENYFKIDGFLFSKEIFCLAFWCIFGIPFFIYYIFSRCGK